MATEVIYALRLQVDWEADQTAMEALYGVGNYYTSLATWESNQNNDLTLATGNDTKQIIEAYADQDWEASYPTLEFIGGLHDNTTDNYMVICAATGEEINFITKVGVQLISHTGDSHGLVIRTGHVLYLEKLGVTFTSTDSTAIGQHDHFEAAHCVFYGCGNGTFKNNNTSFINFCLCEVTNVGNTIQGGGGSIAAVTLHNCVVIQYLGMGSYSGEIAIHESVLYNTIVYNENSSPTYDTIRNCNGDYNAQNDNGSAAPPGANSIEGILTTDFQDYAGGDYRLSYASQLRDAGNNLIDSGDLGSPQYDIDGDQWPGAGGGDWDIGFDYYVSGEPIAGNIYFGVTEIGTIKLGVVDIPKAYLGSQQVFGE